MVRRSLAATGLTTAACLILVPLTGWLGAVRLPAVLVPALAIVLLIVKPWRWPEEAWQAARTWQPSPRFVRAAAIVVGLLLFWLVLTRFRSGEINAVDFTVYFDRPCVQTWQGRPLFVETADAPGFSHRTQLSVHATWAMFPLCAPYGVAASPLWLLAASVVAVTAGAVHVLRIMQRLGASGLLACATALAFVLNDNTARTLNYGFHAEVLYAWFVPWLLDAGLRRHRLSFLAAALACVLVKEDAILPLFGAAVALGLHGLHGVRGMSGADRLLFLVVPGAMALANLGIYYTWVLPALVPDGVPTYANFWANYGPTPMRAVLGMAAQPWRVLMEAATSGFFRKVLLPHLYLPLAGWRWVVGIAPIVLLYGASANPQLRSFGIYYSIVLVPFLAIGASAGALMLLRRFGRDDGRGLFAASTLVLHGALLVGAGYSLRPWRAETAAASEAIHRLGGERRVLVQSSIYPHAGYDARVQLLTPDTLREARATGAVVLLAPALSAYPFGRDDLKDLAQRPPVVEMPDGLVAIRLP